MRKNRILEFLILLITVFIFDSRIANAAPPIWSSPINVQGGPPVVVSAGFINQKTNHLDTKDPRTFKQRFWFSKTHAAGNSSPVLIYICPQGQCGGGVLYGPIHTHAKAVQGYLFALEHRYYGQSQPMKDLSRESLEFLTTEQALLDLVSFHDWIRKERKMTGPLVLVGGSYGGNLAAFARARYPQFFKAALASSAPVKAENNFDSYDLHVAKLAGEQCAKSTREVLRNIEEKISTVEGFLEIKKLFGADKNVSRTDDFLYLLSDISSAAIQYSLRAEFCQKIREQGIEGYALMKKKVDKMYGDFAAYSAEAAEDIRIEKHQGSLGMRQWFYQSCNEYGYWQNAHSEGIRSLQINSLYHERLCARLFGIKNLADTQKMNNHFFQAVISPQTSQIFFTNGTRDPWAALSLHPNSSEVQNTQLELKTIENGFHCDDLYSGGSPEVMAAKSRFQQLLKKWL